MNRALLACGVLSTVLYAAADVLAGLQFEGYSFRDQTISELGAIGALVALVMLHRGRRRTGGLLP